MEHLTRALNVVVGWIMGLGAFLAVLLARADAFLRARMAELGWTQSVQSLAEIVLATAAVLFMLRVFGPLGRLLLVVLLLILALQILTPSRARHVEARCWSVV